MIRKRIPNCVTLTLLCLITASCSPGTQPDSTQPPKVEPTRTAQLPNPTRPTSIPTRSPTVPAKVLYDNFLNWRDKREDCSLPCVWGFQIGETTIDEIHHELDPFVEFSTHALGGDIAANGFGIPWSPDTDTTEYQVAGRFLTSDDILEEIIFCPKYIDPKLTNLTGVLRELGIPSDIIVRLNTEGDFDFYYEMFVIYRELGLSVSTNSDMEIGLVNMFFVRRILLGVQQASRSSIERQELSDVIDYIEEYQYLSDINSQFTNEYFWQAYSDVSSTECIETELQIN